MNKIILIAVALLVLAGGYFAYTAYRDTGTGAPQAGNNNGGRYMDIETYVRTNISEISPVKEQVGGTFYVTDIESSNGSGVVSYEDGHNAYTADFTYTVTSDGQPIINSFIIRSQPPALKWDASSISLGNTRLLSINDFPDTVKVSADAEFGSSDTIKGAILSPNRDWIAIAVGGAAHDFGWVYNIATKKLTPVIFSYGGGVEVKKWNSNTVVAFSVTTPQPATVEKTIDVTALPQYPK